MKICIISNLYPPHVRGGAEKVAADMAAGWVAAGYSVVVISTKPAAGLSIEQQSGRCRVYRFKPLNIFYYLNDFKHSVPIRLLWHFLDMFNLHSAFVVRGILRNERPDIVITHNLKGIGLLIPKIIAREEIRHIHVLHDVQLVVPSGLIIKGLENAFVTSGWMTRVYAALCRWLFCDIKEVVSPSKWLLDFYAANGFFEKAESRVLRNPLVGAKNSVIDEAVKEKVVAARKFLFVGQLESHKGIEWLIEFWTKNNIENELLIVGAGSLSGDIEFFTAIKNIKFIGAVEGAAMRKILKDVAFLIVPSLCYENSPRVIQLAFGGGVPVIVADVGGAAELVENERTGFVFAAGDEESFAGALKKAKALSAEEYANMSRRCLLKLEEFDIDEYIKKVARR